MKVLSFSAIEILRALLNKTKTQTIRPAWKMERYMKQHKSSMFKVIQFPTVPILKEPYFKVGDEIRIEWKSRNSPKGSVFHTKDGSIVKSMIHVGTYENFPGWKELYFTKILGYGKITESSMINFVKLDNGIFMGSPPHFPLENYKYSASLNELAKRDGFPDSETMFKWFDKNYDLSSPKTFFVYRWKEK